MDVPDFEAKARQLLKNGYSNGEVKVLAEAFRAMYEAGFAVGVEQGKDEQHRISLQCIREMGERSVVDEP